MEKISNNFNNFKNEYNSLDKKTNINQSQINIKQINNYIQFNIDKNLMVNNKKIINSNPKNFLISKSQDKNRLSNIGNNIININFPIKSIPLKIHNNKDNYINIKPHKLEENLRYNNINNNSQIHYSGSKSNNNLYKFNNIKNNQKISTFLDFSKNIQYPKSYYIFRKGLNVKKSKEKNISNQGNKSKNSYYNRNRVNIKNIKNSNNNFNIIQNDLHINLINNKLKEIKEKRRIVHKEKEILLKMYNGEDRKIEEVEKINLEEGRKVEERKKVKDNYNLSNPSSSKSKNTSYIIDSFHNNQNKSNISNNIKNTNNFNNSLEHHYLLFNEYKNINNNEIINNIIDEDDNINFENLDNFMKEVDNILNEYNHIRVEIENLINNLNEINKNKVGPINNKLLYKLIIKKIDDINKLHEESKKCIICLEDFINNDIVIYLPCFHVFHKICLMQWIKKHATCPLCKLNINEVLK